MSHLTDDQLLGRFAEGRDEAAFRELVRRHAGFVHATCRRETRDELLTEDAAQATFLVLAHKAASLRGERSLASWLFTTARLESRNLLREERRRRDREARAAAEMERDTHPEPAWSALEPLLNDALARLKAPDRQAVVLRYLEGRSLTEVAAELSLGENAARMRVARAVDRLRANLGRSGAAVGSAALVALLERDASAAQTPFSIPNLRPTALLGKASVLAMTTASKALFVSSAAIVVAGGFVFVRSRPALDEATIRVAFRPLAGTWKGVVDQTTSDGRHEPTSLLIEAKPEGGGLGLSFEMRFPDRHEGDRKRLSFDPSGRLVVKGRGDDEVYEPVGLREFAARGRGLLAFVGKGKNERGPTDLKLSFDVQGERMTMRQERRQGGETRTNSVDLERAR